MNGCEGRCETRDGHKGDVKKCWVASKTDISDWQIFWYCDTAIQIDRENGFIVETSSIEALKHVDEALLGDWLEIYSNLSYRAVIPVLFDYYDICAEIERRNP